MIPPVFKPSGFSKLAAESAGTIPSNVTFVAPVVTDSNVVRSVNGIRADSAGRLASRSPAAKKPWD